MKRLLWILWPLFAVAGVAEMLFFTFIDPQELYLFGAPVNFSRMTVYSLGFFGFWATCAASSLFTCFLQRAPDEVNICMAASTCKDRVGRKP